MALNILKKSDKFRYLFDEAAFKAYDPSEEQFNDIKKSYIEHEKYFSSIKKSMQSKDAYKDIVDREPNRASAFSDLDNSIRAAYKILLDVRAQLEDGGVKKEHKIWIGLSRWVNFEKWFAYEREPRVERLIGEAITNLRAQVNDEIERYEMGNIE